MKLILKHSNHQPSPSFTELLKKHLEPLREGLQIDEAHVFLERRLEASPPFRITAHLVTPGPDVFAEAVDHTLRAALNKMTAQLEARIDHRHQKRARNVQDRFKSTSSGHVAKSGTRH